MDTEIERPKMNILTFVALILVGGIVIFKIFPGLYYLTHMSENSIYKVSKENCDKNFNEDDFIDLVTDGLQPSDPFIRMKYDCRDRYFIVENRNWVELRSFLMQSVVDKSKEPEIRAIAKEITEKGLKYVDILSRIQRSRGTYNLKYKGWDDLPFITDKYAGHSMETADHTAPTITVFSFHDANPEKMPDDIYTSYVEKITEIKTSPDGRYVGDAQFNREAKGVRLEGSSVNDAEYLYYTTDKEKKYLIVVDMRDSKPYEILDAYEITTPQTIDKPYGPFLIKLFNNEWIYFNGDISFCQIINLEKNEGKYKFVPEACSFDENGKLILGNLNN